MPPDTETDATAAAPQGAVEPPPHLAAARSERLPFPPRTRRFRVDVPKPLRKPIRALDRDVARLIERLAATPKRRQRAAIAGALAVNVAILALLAIYGRVRIFVPNKPADSISVVFVDLPVDPPDIELRDPEIAEEPEPVIEPEIAPPPLPEPPAAEREPEPEPDASPEPEPEPVIDLTPEPPFAPPSEIEEAPLIPEAEPEPSPTVEEPLPGDIAVEGEQAPAEEAPPLVSVEPQAREAEAQVEAQDEEEEETQGAGEIAADAPSDLPAPSPEPTLSGDDAFDEDPVFGGSRLALPPVDLPQGERSATPGTSGIVAIYCPKEFKDAEKIAECAGRPEIRSGWRPGASGEDFSKAAAILKDRRKHGDFSGDATTFGPEIARQLEERRRLEELEDVRKSQKDIHDLGVKGGDPAAGTRPDFGRDGPESGWTRREDPLVDRKDVEKLREELEEAEKKKSPQ
jgi:hypothetical protein